jgi:hypothetical protein
MQIQGKKLVDTPLSNNTKVTTDKHTVWKRNTVHEHYVGKGDALNIFINDTIRNWRYIAAFPNLFPKGNPSGNCSYQKESLPVKMKTKQRGSW